jgi:predicted ATP-binding protein involved in virulence
MSEKLYLKRAELSGFRTIKDVSVDFKEGLNIIIGKNGAGKTNFLGFLDKALNQNYENLHQFEAKLLLDNGEDIVIKAKQDINFVTNDKPMVKSVSETFIRIGNKLESKWDRLGMEINKTLEKNEIFFSTTLILHGIPADYPIVNSALTVTISKDGGWGEILDLAFGRKYTSFHNKFGERLLLLFSLYGTNELESIEDELHEIFFAISELRHDLRLYTPIQDIRFSRGIQVQEDIERNNIVISNIQLEFKIGGIWLPFSSLSDGTKRLFYIFSEVRSEVFTASFTDGLKSEKTSSPRILLIEEPELGIHPHQFQQLMEFLKIESERKQIIISTHSPQALDVLPEDELDRIIIAYNEEGDSTKLRHLTEAELSKAKRYIKEDFLSDYWLYSDLEK